MHTLSVHSDHHVFSFSSYILAKSVLINMPLLAPPQTSSKKTITTPLISTTASATMPRPRSTETDSLGGQRSSFTSHGPSRNSTRRDDNTLGDGPTLPKTPLRTFSFSSGDEACGLSPIREESQHFHSPSSAIDYDAIVAAYIRAYCSRISERVKAVAGQNLKLFLRELCAKEDDAIWAVRLGYQPEDWSTEVESDELEEETNFRNLVWEHSVRHVRNPTVRSCNAPDPLILAGRQCNGDDAE